MSPMMPDRAWVGWARRIIGGAVAAISLFYIARRLWLDWPSLGGAGIRPGPMLLAILLGIAALSVNALLWGMVLHGVGGDLGGRATMRTWFLSQLLRYAPGHVWHFLGRAYLARDEGVAASAVGLSIALELMHTVTSALLVGAILLPTQRGPGGAIGLLPLAAIPLLACYAMPGLLRGPIAWALRRAGASGPAPDLRRRDLFKALSGYCAAWLVYGCGLYFLARSVYPISPSALPALPGIFAIAWAVGFLSFLTPSGLGVREGMLSLLLGSVMPTPFALLVSLLARAWLTLAELGCAAAVACWPSARKPEAVPHSCQLRGARGPAMSVADAGD